MYPRVSASLKDLVEVMKVSDLQNAAVLGHASRGDEVRPEGREEDMLHYPPPRLVFVQRGTGLGLGGRQRYTVEPGSQT